MAQRAQIASLVARLDDVLFSSFVITYFLDGNLLELVVKGIAQTQFREPKVHHPERSLKFHTGICCLLNGLALFYHLATPLQRNPRGLIIDFIGQSYLPNTFQLFVMDIITTLLQILLIVLSFESAHYGEEADFDDTSATLADKEDDDFGDETAIPDSNAAEREALTGLSYKAEIAKDQPILNLRLRHTFHRIMHDKPSSSSTSVTDGSTTDVSAGTAATVTRLRQMRARVRARARELGNALPDDSSLDRIDEVSDEERETGTAPPRGSRR